MQLLEPATRTTSDSAVSETARPYRGRRLSWREFYQLRPDRRPAAANDNQDQREVA